MKEDKILLCVNNKDEVKYSRDLGISNFLFPLEGFSIGYETFSLKEIEELNINSYLLVNRLLTDKDIDEFLKLEIPKNVKGLLIEDLGLFYALKNTTSLELINFQNHLNNSYPTINFWLDHFDSLVLSTDITLEEIEEILNQVSKPLVINTFAYPMIMYSRRHLISNFKSHINSPKKDTSVIEIPNQVSFKLSESPYGTAVFDNHLLDIREEVKTLDDSKIKFYLFNTRFLTPETIKKAITGEPIENTTKGFLNTKTIYKVGDAK